MLRDRSREDKRQCFRNCRCLHTVRFRRQDQAYIKLRNTSQDSQRMVNNRFRHGLAEGASQKVFSDGQDLEP